MAESHVLVLMDTSPASEAALESAARLARHHQLELVALFIQDQDLIASAGHLFAREISLLSGEARPFDREILLARLARQRQQIETRLNALDRLRWRLQVETGSVIDKILQAAPGAEWVVLGKAGWSASRGARLGSTARHLVETTHSRLFLSDGPTGDSQEDIVALVADLTDAEAMIETTRQLALATDRNVRLLVLPGHDTAVLSASGSRQQPLRPAITVERLAGNDIEALRRALQTPAAAALVIDERGASALGLPMADVIARIDTPVIRISLPP